MAVPECRVADQPESGRRRGVWQASSPPALANPTARACNRHRSCHFRAISTVGPACTEWSVRALTFSAPHFGSRDKGIDQWDPRGKKKKFKLSCLLPLFFSLGPPTPGKSPELLPSEPLFARWLVASLLPPPISPFPSACRNRRPPPPTCSRNNSALPRDVWDEHLQQKQTKPHLLLVALSCSSAACSMRAGL